MSREPESRSVLGMSRQGDWANWLGSTASPLTARATDPPWASRERAAGTVSGIPLAPTFFWLTTPAAGAPAVAAAVPAVPQQGRAVSPIGPLGDTESIGPGRPSQLWHRVTAWVAL